MASRDVLCLTIGIFLNEVGKDFLFLHLGDYLFNVAHDNRDLPRGRKENVISITIAQNLSVTR